MKSYMAYIPVKNKDGEDVVLTAPGQTIGQSVRDSISNLNAAMSVSGGYTQDPKELSVMVVVYEIASGIERIRHEIEGDLMRVFQVNADDTSGEAINHILIVRVNPMTVNDVFVS